MSATPHQALRSSSTALVIGGGLGGLSAAIHLRLAGAHVLLLEANERVGGRAGLLRFDGYRFDTGPSLLNYPWVFENLFGAAGKRMRDYVDLIPVDPSIRFQWPDGASFTLSARLDLLIEECSRLEPGSAPAVMAFLRDTRLKYDLAFAKLVSRNADSLWEWVRPLTLRECARISVWRSLHAELGRFFRNRRIREALGSYGMYLGGSPFELPGFFSILAYGELAYGLWLPRGGIFGLIEGVERLARELGVDIRVNARVRGIRVENARVQGIELESGEILDAPVVISNVDLPATNLRLLPQAYADRAARRTQRTSMTCGAITFYWGLRRALPNMPHHSIFLPDDYRGAFDALFRTRRPSDDPAFYTSIASATDAALAPPGAATMFVLVPVPLLEAAHTEQWDSIVQDMRRHILKRLARHGIAIGREDIVHEIVWTPPEWERRFGLHRGSAFGAAHTLLQNGPLRSSNWSRDIHGLYYAGASTTPGTGLPMVALSGKLAAERALS